MKKFKTRKQLKNEIKNLRNNNEITQKTLADILSTLETVKKDVSILNRSQTRSELEWFMGEITNILDDIIEQANTIDKDIQGV